MEKKSTKLRKNSIADTGQLSDALKGVTAGGQPHNVKQPRLPESRQTGYAHSSFRRPGEILAQAACYLGILPGIGRIYLHTVVDIFSFFSFGFLHTSDAPEGAVAILHNEVLPFYRQQHILVEAIQTNKLWSFCGQGMHLFELYLALQQIHHCFIPGKGRQNCAGTEYFRQTVMAEFFRAPFHQKSYESIAVVQQELNAWLRYYNYRRPSAGDVQGRPPGDILQAYRERKGT
jgi:transposase InsO family protein